jgi:hypothetical protein
VLRLIQTWASQIDPGPTLPFRPLPHREIPQPTLIWIKALYCRHL